MAYRRCLPVLLVAPVLFFLVAGPCAAVAEVSAPVPPVVGMQVEKNPLVVAGVIVDKTAANAVVAREEAMADARRLAFRKLAQTYMPAQAALDLPLPDDQTLGTLVQDFEIKRERLSSTRYVGDFTVRFRDGVRRFIPVPSMHDEALAEQAGTTAGLQDESGNAEQPAGQAGQLQPAGRVRLTAPVVILPYLQNIAGQMILWGEPNAWREVWQTQPPRPKGLVPDSDVARAEGKVIVPLGDIADISAGPDSAIWSGNYAALDKMRENYGVQTVVVAVANRSGAQMRVDLYDYTGDTLVRRGRVEPVVDAAADDRAAFALAARDTLREILTAPVSVSAVAQKDDGATLESISRALTSGHAAPSVDGTPSFAAGVSTGAAQAGAAAPVVVSGRGTQVQAGMHFDDFMTWMETQKRLAGIVPAVRVNIQTISRDQARFTLGFEGDLGVLTTLLAERGLRLSQAGTGDYQLSLVQ